jgi:formylglycine-generating enzyme required for sulfatase activity
VVASFCSSYGQALDAPASGDGVVNSLGMRMVRVPAGSFPMGSAPGAPMRQEEELEHRVTLTRAFRIASMEVTQRQWLALMPSNRSPQPGDDLPVTSVSWREAREFCLKLSQREGALYRLPTEAEWEYACRAGTDDPPADRAELEVVAWHADNSGERAHPVGQKAPNPWGLFDLLGNVAEWTLDAYGPYPRLPATDPAGSPTGSTRVVRGGAWRSFPPAVRCAARTGTPESYQLSHVGLRVVQEIE